MQTHQRLTLWQNSVVVFSQHYLPMSRIPLKRAVVLLVTGQAVPVDFLNGQVWVVRSPNRVLHVPEYIRLTLSHPARQWKVPTASRREIFRRDRHTCQYCGSTKHLTLDHVMPRSRGGSHTWDNLVTACTRCNSQKGNRTPQEAGFILRTKPKAPIHPAIAFAEQFWQSQQTD